MIIAGMEVIDGNRPMKFSLKSLMLFVTGVAIACGFLNFDRMIHDNYFRSGRQRVKTTVSLCQPVGGLTPADIESTPRRLGIDAVD